VTEILVVDNYDSFAYNLVQYLGQFADVTVRRNDAVDTDGIRALDPDGVVVSPGPGTPAAAGVSIPVFAELSYPTLGVCLGHQALCAANGGHVGQAPEVVHGKHDVPDSLAVAARTADDRGVVMAVRHRDRPHVGVQFHPESILTDAGERLVENFVSRCE
jgi:anthranilate synthase component 2